MGCPHPHGRAGGSEGLPSDVGGRVSADAWSVIASPFLPKYLSSPRCAALHGALYLVGDNTKKVYVYDPGANLWQKVSHPPPRKEQAWAVGPPGAGGRGRGLQTQGPRAPPSRGPGAAGHCRCSVPNTQRNLSSSSRGQNQAWPGALQGR